MKTPKITGDEPYYPFLTSNSDWPDVIQITDETGRNLLNFVPGITIRQKFITDYMRELGVKMHSPKDPTNWDAIEKESEAAFKSYLKIINGE